MSSYVHACNKQALNTHQDVHTYPMKTHLWQSSKIILPCISIALLHSKHCIAKSCSEQRSYVLCRHIRYSSIYDVSPVLNKGQQFGALHTALWSVTEWSSISILECHICFSGIVQLQLLYDRPTTVHMWQHRDAKCLPPTLKVGRPTPPPNPLSPQSRVNHC